MNQGHEVHKSDDTLEYWMTCDRTEFARKRWTLAEANSMDYSVRRWMDEEMKKHLEVVHPKPQLTDELKILEVAKAIHKETCSFREDLCPHTDKELPIDVRLASIAWYKIKELNGD